MWEAWMGGRTDIDDEALERLDRAWRGATEGILWPLAIADALHPVSAMTAWARADARDPRCLWWTLARFGADAMADACDELEEADKARAIDWMRLHAQDAWIEDQPVTVAEGWRYRLDPSGATIWEKGGG
jgi:hypothetical protein